MHILITGGCGFIGSNVAEFHINKGDDVWVVDNLSTGTIDNIQNLLTNPKFKFSESNVLTWNELGKAVKWADRIYHFAAVVGMFKALSEPVNLVINNILGCQHLLQSISINDSNALVIVASSSSVYGDNPGHRLTETDNLIIKTPPHPLSTYTISKLADESICLAYHQEYKIPIIIVRLFNTIGPRQTGRYGMVVPRFVKQACRHEPFSIFGDGLQTRSFCDVRDAIVALDLLANQPKAVGEIINVGNDHETSILALTQTINRCIGYENSIEYIPYQRAYGTEYTDISQRRPNLSKLYQMIPFKHQWTLEQTINNLISIYTHIP